MNDRQYPDHHRSGRAYTYMFAQVYGYMLALEDVLKDMQDVSSLEELKEVVLQSYREAETTRNGIKSAATGS